MEIASEEGRHCDLQPSRLNTGANLSGPPIVPLSEEDRRRLAELMGDEPKADDVAEQGETFAQAAAKLMRQEMEFASGIVRGLSPAQAAKKAWPSKKIKSATEVAARPEIARVVELGRRELALALQKETHYDVATAARDLETRIAAAALANQHSAVASLTALRLKLHGLLIERSEVQQAGFVINVSGVDPSKMAGTARVIDGEVVGEGV